jgi:chemotaxis protein MotB
MSQPVAMLRSLPGVAGSSVQPVAAWQRSASDSPHNPDQWELSLFDDPGPPRSGEDEVWMLSYMDVMTLLLTLFVLLFAYLQAAAPATEQTVAAQVTERVEPPLAAVIPISLAPAAIAVALGVGTDVPLPTSWPAAAEAAEPAIPELRAVGTTDEAEERAVPAPEGWQDQPAVAGAPVEVEPRSAATMPVGDEPPVVDEREALAPAAPLVEETTRFAEAAEPADTPEPNQPPQVARDDVPDRTRNELLEAIRASALGKRVEITDRQDRVDLEVSDDILFDPGSASLSPLGQQLLAELAALLRQQGFAISVEGHTDSRPIRNARFASNWELSAARATSVTRELIEHAVEPGRVRAVGYADTRPRADNSAPEGRARNRRVALVLHVPAGVQVDP